jgi:hypothetical protein
MSLDTVARPLDSTLSGRFFLVGYLPTVTAAVFVLLLLWAGAPASPPRFSEAWHTAAALGAGQIVLLALAVTLVALVLHPLQVLMVRLLEGYWPRWAGPATRCGLAWQRRREQRFRERMRLPEGRRPDDGEIRRAGIAATTLRLAFPARLDLIRPTALGNVIAAFEERAGGAYGWDTPVAWPRLYPLLGVEVRAIVDDRRDVLDAMCRFTMTALLTAVVTAGLLAAWGWWVLLALAPAALGWIAYQAAIRAAGAFGEAIRVAFDLNRFAIYPALHVALPADPAAERAANRALCAAWRQGADPAFPYAHIEAVEPDA